MIDTPAKPAEDPDEPVEDPGEWAPIPGWPHEASKHGGRIRSPRGRILAQKPSNRPVGPGPKYQLVNLCADGKKKTATVHTLVLLAHRPRRDGAGNVVGDGRPPGMVARHKDDVPYHNDLDNLAWGTPSENSQDKPVAVRHRAAVIARAGRTDIPVRRTAARRPWWRRLFGHGA